MASKKKKNAKTNGEWTEGENPEPKGGAPTHSSPHRKPYSRKVAVDASPEESSAVAHDLADLLTREATVKARRREFMAGIKEELSGIQDRKMELVECVRSNRKLVDVRVQEFFVADGTIEVRRIDSGEIVERRTADAEDHQRSLEDGASA